MKKQQIPSLSSQEGKDVLDLIDNTNKRFTLGRQQILLLLKKQKQKEYCTLYITDCQSKFWVKKVDRDFLEELKDGMSINTSLSVFCEHLVRNLKDKSKLKIENGQVTIEIELVIGEGLVMNCSFSVQYCIKSQQKPNDYRTIMKIFLKELYEAKQAQIDEQRKKWQRIKQQQEDRKFQNHEKVDPTYVKQVLNGNLKKNDVLNAKMKNRSLMNPNQKKRKAGPIKFAGDDQV